MADVPDEESEDEEFVFDDEDGPQFQIDWDNIIGDPIIQPRHLKVCAFIIGVMDLLWLWLLTKYAEIPENIVENDLAEDGSINNVSTAARLSFVLLFFNKATAGSIMLSNVVLSDDPNFIKSRLQDYVHFSCLIFVLAALSSVITFSMGGAVPLEMMALAWARFADTALLYGYLNDLDEQADERMREMERIQQQRGLERVQQRIEELVENDGFGLRWRRRVARNNFNNQERN